MSIQDILITDNNVFDRAREKKVRHSLVEYISIPALALKFEITANTPHRDFLSDAVMALKDIYKNMSHKEIVSTIAKDLQLTDRLIETIIKAEKAYEKELYDSENCEVKETKTINVFYDLLSKTYLPIVLDGEMYEQYKQECEDFSKYRKSIGDSNPYYIYRLQATSNEIVNPKEDDIYEVLKTVLGRKGNEVKILYTGVSEYVDIVSALYYDPHDLNSYCAEHPFNDGRASWVLEDVKIYLENKGRGPDKLREILDKMKQSFDVNQKRISQKERNESESLLAECERKVYKRYNAEEINKYAIKESLVNNVVKYAKILQIQSDDELINDFELVDKTKKEYYTAMFTFIEKILEHCFNKYYVSKNLSKYMKYLSEIDDGAYCIWDYTKAIETIGFDASSIDESERILKQDIEYIFKQQNANNKIITTLLYGNIIEALFDETHPFNLLCYEYPKMFEIIYEAQELRKPSKHGNRNRIKSNYFDFQKFVYTLFDYIVLKPQNENINLTDISVEHSSYIREEYKRIDDEVAVKMEGYCYLTENEDAYYHARALERAMLSKDREYLSEAYNLIDELLKQLTFVYSGRNNEADKDMLKEILNDNYDRNNVAAIASSTLKRYGSDYEFKNRYNEDDFIYKTYTAKYSLGNRLFYLVFLLDKRHPEFFKRFLSENADIFSLIERICDPINGRGHNNDTKFDNEIIDFHKKILKVCENICKYVSANDLKGEL